MTHNATTVAIVGPSRNDLRASYFVGYYLKRHGYGVVPVNPGEPEILGEPSLTRPADVPVHVDIVSVFRASGIMLAAARPVGRPRRG